MSKDQEPANTSADGGAGSSGGANTPRRSGAISREIDQDVERAFDLLGHYQSLLRNWQSSLTDKERNRALDSIEEVLRRWMPRAEPAKDPVLVAGMIGKREAAAQALAEVKLWPARVACLQRLAVALIPPTLDSVRASATCREEIRRWRELLPMFRRGANGQRYIDQSDWHVAATVGSYWSSSLESRPSRLGASFFLAAACDAVAAAAHREGTPKATLRPAFHLAQRLRESPDWTHVDAFDVIGVLDEQVALVRKVEELLAEIDLRPTIQAVALTLRTLRPEENQILDIVVQRFLETADYVRGREIRIPLSSRLVRNADSFLDGLVPCLLERQGSSPNDFYRPTMLGCVHTRWAADFSAAVERMLGFLRKRASQDPGFRNYTWEEVRDVTEWDDQHLPLARAVILACGLGGGGSYGSDSFGFETPADLEALIALSGFSELVDYRASIDQKQTVEQHIMDRPSQPDTTNASVFLVHGHNEGAKHAVARFVESKLKLHLVILDEQPNKGQSIIEKLEANSDVQFAIVLFTGDDEGRVKAKGTEVALCPRARQNVVLELGYFVGSLGRGRVCVIHEEGVEMPSDYYGVGYIPLDQAGGWQRKLAMELEAAGLAVDAGWYK